MDERGAFERNLDRPPWLPEAGSTEIRNRLGALDGLPGAPEPSDGGGEQRSHLEPTQDFLDWHERHRGTGAAYEPTGARTRWTEHPDNPGPERYTHDAAVEVEVQDRFAEHGFDQSTIDQINGIGGTTNCGECARAVADTLEGSPHAAADITTGGERLNEMERWADAPFNAEQAPDDALRSVDDYLQQGGDGTQVIVAAYRADDSGHFFNVARLEGRPVLIDAQTNVTTGRATLLEGDARREYLRAQQFTDLQWVPIERSNR